MRNLPKPPSNLLEPNSRNASPGSLAPELNSDPVFPGMGAIVTPQGVAFRVWAPHAKSVAVVGTFNDWSESATLMTAEDNGNWYCLVTDAAVQHEYRYVIETPDGNRLSRIDPRALAVTNSIGNGVVWQSQHRPEPLPNPIPQHEMVIYEMHVGSFHCPEEGKAGTFQSAIEKLDYLKDLGINAIEIMPVAEFAGDFSWGYNPAHPFAVESAYGGPDGLLAFVTAAHERGIAVIIDVVYNHLGPSDLSMWQFDGWSENGMGGIYFYNDWRANTPWGDTRPDYGRGEVRSYIRDNALMWFQTYGVDGLRWDMSVYIRTYRGTGTSGDDLKEGWGLMQWVNEEIQREFPGSICIAEDLRDSDWLVKHVSDGGAGFTAQWMAGFVHPLRSALTSPTDEARSLDPLIDAIKGRFDNDAFKRVVYTESHDEVANGKARVPTEVEPEDAEGYFARKRSILGAAIVLTSPGIPMLFQGQEFLEDQWFRDDVPLDFGKLQRLPGVHQMFRDLIRLRLDGTGPSRGLCSQEILVHHVNHLEKVIAYLRGNTETGRSLVVVNLSNQTLENYRVGVPDAGLWSPLFNSDSSAYCEDFSNTQAEPLHSQPEAVNGFEDHLPMKIGPYSALILVHESCLQAAG